MHRTKLYKRKGQWVMPSVLLVALTSIGMSANAVAAHELPTSHQVQAGDTLYSNATKNGMAVSELQSLNGLNSTLSIQVPA